LTIKTAFIGAFLLFMLSACQTVSTPDQVTTAFWKAMVDGDIETARSHTMHETQHLVTRQQNLEDASLETGKVLIDGGNARVATVLTLQKPENNRILSFDTVLAKENNRWKVDYQQTLNNLLHQPFGEIFKSLGKIGEAINKELEQQIPLFEQQLKSFSEELIRQLEEFRRELEKNLPPEKQQLHPGTT
jgi:hypothetical protein